jgi:hypothetical protein
MRVPLRQPPPPSCLVPRHKLHAALLPELWRHTCAGGACLFLLLQPGREFVAVLLPQGQCYRTAAVAPHHELLAVLQTQHGDPFASDRYEDGIALTRATLRL